MYSEKLPIELAQAKELILDRKMEEALEIITNFEQKEGITPEDLLSIHLLKGRIHAFYWQFVDAIKLGEEAYQLSQQLGIIPSIVEALNLKAHIAITGPFDTALEYIIEGERLINYIPHSDHNL